MIPVKVKRLRADAVIPTYGTPDAACFDIGAAHAGMVHARGKTVFDTGLSFEIPQKHVMLLFSRSGQAYKNDLRLSNCVGVIDADYRGELKVMITSDSDVSYPVYTGDRIAQALVLPIEQVTFIEDELSDTVRGEGGFGSTGV